MAIELLGVEVVPTRSVTVRAEPLKPMVSLVEDHPYPKVLPAQGEEFVWTCEVQRVFHFVEDAKDPREHERFNNTDVVKLRLLLSNQRFVLVGWIDEEQNARAQANANNKGFWKKASKAIDRVDRITDYLEAPISTAYFDGIESVSERVADKAFGTENGGAATGNPSSHRPVRFTRMELPLVSLSYLRSEYTTRHGGNERLDLGFCESVGDNKLLWHYLTLGTQDLKSFLETRRLLFDNALASKRSAYPSDAALMARITEMRGAGLDHLAPNKLVKSSLATAVPL